MGAIEGVHTRPLRIIPTAGGPVLHMLRSDDPEFTAFGEVYCSEVESGAIKAWKRHTLMTQHFIVPVGRVLFVLYDNRQSSPTCGQVLEYELGRPDAYSLLTLPPLIWYGFKGMAAYPSLIVNCTNLAHQANESERADADASWIPYVWQ
jgi:dTDP-4-dehydrorhamnose 3,5-epimerase